MNLQSKKIRQLGGVALMSSLLLMSSACGIRKYPGQPGVVTNGYSKLSMEYLDGDGLFIYEATYDNRSGKGGVESVVTKLYQGARTYTSNVRTNAEGTKYVTRDEYKGAVVQLIYLPRTGELIIPQDSKIQVMIDYGSSMDEVDHVNQAEVSLFQMAAEAKALSSEALKRIQTKLNLLRAGKMDSTGTLSYTVTKARIGLQEFIPLRPIQVQTNLTQSGVRSTFTKDLQKQLAAFIEAKYPQGFSGEVQLSIVGNQEPITFRVGLNTIKTIEAAGTAVHRNVSKADLQKWLQRARNNNEKQSGVQK